MNKTPKTKRVHVTTYTLKAANNKVVSSKTQGGIAARTTTGKFVSRDEIKAAFKSASQKLKSA